MTDTFRVRAADWTADGPDLCRLRESVFVVEQGVPLELEYDGLDPTCEHVLAMSPAGRVIGTGRLLPDGRIGRMAVAADWRGHGVGRALLRHLIRRARERGMDAVELHAQCTAVDFYRAAGFQAFGPVFDDAGIPHQRMRLVLSGS